MPGFKYGNDTDLGNGSYIDSNGHVNIVITGRNEQYKPSGTGGGNGSGGGGYDAYTQPLVIHNGKLGKWVTRSVHSNKEHDHSQYVFEPLEYSDEQKKILAKNNEKEKFSLEKATKKFDAKISATNATALTDRKKALAAVKGLKKIPKVDEAKTKLSKTTSEVTRLKSLMSTSLKKLTDKRVTTLVALLDASLTEFNHQFLLGLVKGLKLKNGQYGTEIYGVVSSNKEHDHWGKIFQPSGLTQLQIDNAELNAKNKRAAADKLVKEVTVAEQEHLKATMNYNKAETNRQVAQEELKAAKVKEEQDLLIKASEIIAASGEGIGKHFNDSYKAIAKEISEKISNFQGKKIRNINDALKSFDKMMANPKMKLNKADRLAVIKAWESIDAKEVAERFNKVSKTFKIADVVLKVRAIKEKTIEGYKTGDWKPLMLEVEAMVLSGFAAGSAISLLTMFFSSVLPAGLALNLVVFILIVGVSYVSSLIDASLADSINKIVLEGFH